jgi:hypothetical protein
MLTEQQNEQLTKKAQELKSAFSAAASGAAIPSSYYVLETNIFYPNSDGWTFIAVPQAGTLWIGYEWVSNPAQSIYVWHQAARITAIEPGLNNYIPVRALDAIVYQLANPSTDMIRLGWGYV